MAAPMSSSSSTSDSDENSEKINPLSPMFDARRALYAKSVKLPVQDPRLFNNVAEFENYLKGNDSSSLKKMKKEKKLPGIIAERAAAQARENVRKAAILAKSGGPHERSQTQMRKIRATTVFTRIEGYKGPLSILRRCMEEKIKVVVVIRAAVSVRSRCKGFVIAFDKHFNMALMDVDETYIKRCKEEKDKTTSVLKEQNKDSTTKYSAPAPRLVKSQSSSQASVTKTTESVVREKLSEIFHGVSTEERRLSDSYSEKCKISGVKNEMITSSATRKTGSETRRDTSDSRRQLHNKNTGKSSSDGHLPDESKPGKGQLKKETINKPGPSAEQMGTDHNLSVGTSKENMQLKTESDFWALYKAWAEKRCLTKFEVLDRHVNQLFIRGDNVVSISVAQ